MQALQRHQRKPFSQSLPFPSPPSPHLTLADQLHQASLTGDTTFCNQELLNSYLESQQASLAHQPFIVGDQYLPGAFDLANPSIRIQQSTPTPQLTAFSDPPSMLSANATASGLHNWGSYAQGNGQLDNQSLHAPSPARSARTHHRAASSSSTGSNGSHYQSTGHGAGFSAYPNNQHHLPTPTQTPTQDSFVMNPNFAHFNPNVDSAMAAHLSMKQALMDQHIPEEDVPGFAHSGRHSVSSYGHDSPATPHTAHEDFVDERFKVPPTDMRNTVPKLERTYPDAAVDELYNPSYNVAQIPHSTAQSNRPLNSSMLSPYGNSNSVVKNALKAAENARSQSPSSSASRGVSPFRPSYPGNHAFSSPRVRVGTAAEAREQQKAEADAYAMRVPPNEEPKTISPKDALLDYSGEAEDDSKGPLFPDSGASEYEHQYNSGDQYRNTAQSSFDTTSAQNYRRDNWSTPQFSPNFATSSGPGPSSQTTFSFAPPSIQGNLHGLSSYSPQQYRSMPTVSEPTPDFPAHLTSMESSASETDTVTATTAGESLQRPVATNADTGTYTCTYHGCTLRFETPQKLQKHKREGHRNVNPSTVGANGLTSQQMQERNSQAGPHKCERINPTTGKPCNTIFSRPYDLTRHEDTIHNARKQKVRCALCVEEKTFSRNDALTRHMRVVHPEVDFPGKHRRRGANHD